MPFAFYRYCLSDENGQKRRNSGLSKPTPTPAKAKNNEPLTIAAVGDIMLGSTSINDTFLPPNDGADMFEGSYADFSEADITFGNLEGPMLEGGKTRKMSAEFDALFRFSRADALREIFERSGF